MKRILIIIVALLISNLAQSQEVTSYNSYIETIANNNPMIKSLSSTLEGEKIGNKIGLTPSDPQIQATPMFDGSIEVTGSVNFLFPTLYHQMNKFSKMSSQKNDFEYQLALYAKMQEIEQAYIEYVSLNKKLELAEQINDSYTKLFKYISSEYDEGNKTLLDVNSAKLQLIQSQSNYRNTQTMLDSKAREIVALNGGNDIKLYDVNYPVYNIGDIDTYAQRAIEKSYAIKISKQDSLIAAQNVKVNNHSWTPNITVGYKYSSPGAKMGVSGVIAGVSLPLWANSHKSNAAKMNYQAAIENSKNSVANAEVEIHNLVAQYNVVRQNLDMYDNYLNAWSNIKLLKKALDAGEMSIIDYYTEINVIVAASIEEISYEQEYYTLLSKMKSLLY